MMIGRPAVTLVAGQSGGASSMGDTASWTVSTCQASSIAAADAIGRTTGRPARHCSHVRTGSPGRRQAGR